MSRVVNRGTVNGVLVAVRLSAGFNEPLQKNLLATNFKCFVSQVVPAEPNKLAFTLTHDVFEDVSPHSGISLRLALDLLIPDLLLIYSIEENTVNLLRLVVFISRTKVVIFILLLVFTRASGNVKTNFSVLDKGGTAGRKATKASVLKAIPI